MDMIMGFTAHGTYEAVRVEYIAGLREFRTQDLIGEARWNQLTAEQREEIPFTTVAFLTREAQGANAIWFVGNIMEVMLAMRRAQGSSNCDEAIMIGYGTTLPVALSQLETLLFGDKEDLDTLNQEGYGAFGLSSLDVAPPFIPPQAVTGSQASAGAR